MEKIFQIIQPLFNTINRTVYNLGGMAFIIVTTVIVELLMNRFSGAQNNIHVNLYLNTTSKS